MPKILRMYNFAVKNGYPRSMRNYVNELYQYYYRITQRTGFLPKTPRNFVKYIVNS